LESDHKPMYRTSTDIAEYYTTVNLIHPAKYWTVVAYSPKMSSNRDGFQQSYEFSTGYGPLFIDERSFNWAKHKAFTR